MIQIVRSMASVAPLFAGWQETIIWSCLQGEMGEVYAPVGEAPVSALATLGDFTFLAGEPREELVRFLPPNRPARLSHSGSPERGMGPVHCRGVPPGPPGDPLCHGKDRDAI